MRFPSLVFPCLLLAVAMPGRAAVAPPPHPRLLAAAEDFERIRGSVTQEGPLRDAFLVLQASAEREHAEPPVGRVVIGRRMLDTSRTALRRILNFALLHRLTEDPRWAARAEREMLALAAFSDWNPSHFLDVAEAAAAVAIGYDWTYDALSPEVRRTLREALVKHALLPGDNEALWWRKGVNNWRQVCEAGLALAALVVVEDEPELAARAIGRAHRNVPRIFATYEPAGSYVEGPMYWDYGTSYHVMLIEALRTATGSSGELARNDAFLQSAAVVNHLTAPSGDFYNFGDCQPRRGFLPAMYWFARETGDPSVAAHEPARLAGMRDRLSKRPDQAGLPGRFLALALLWMPAGPAPRVVAPAASWATEGANPVAIFRRGEGREALYAGMKGGRARISHGHMDAGGFVLELGGVRWATDPGMPVYHDLEQAGVQLFGKDRWSVYVLGPHGHSIPLIDDLPPDDEATATLRHFSAEARSATFDLTPLYAGRATRLHRELRIDSTDTVVVRDVVEGVAPGSRYRFSWMTRAAAEADAAGVTLRHRGRTLRIDFAADVPFEVFDEDVSRPPAAHDAPQPGLRRVGLVFIATGPAHAVSATARLIDRP